MNNQSESNLKSQLIISLLVFIGVIVLGVIFRKALQTTVVVSIQYVVWLGDFFIKVIGQQYLWLLILILTLGLSFDFSRLLKSSSNDHRPGLDGIEVPESGRIDFWRYRIFRYRKVSDGSNYFLLEFPRLIIDTLAFHERKEPDQIKEEIILDDIEVPVEVRNFITLDDLPTVLEEEPGAFQGIRNLIQQIQGEPIKPVPDSDVRLEKVAAYLEDLLEDENDI
jgi:hypothetical protein